MRKSLLFYGVIVGLFSVLLWLIISYGEKDFEKEKVKIEITTNEAATGHSSWDIFSSEVIHNLRHGLARLILQIILIVLIARFFGLLFTKMKQPAVIGEILAGIVLGPSLLGAHFPAMSHFLFPEESFQNLQMLSQIGLIFFMFIIGMELDVKVLKNKAHAAVVISHASIIIPYFLGVCLAYYLFESFASPQISFTAFALFMGIAMSITAFPVLARIIQERGMTKTNLGTMAITCAAADDITAWCILAVVVAIVKAGDFASAGFTIGFSVLYVVFMLLVVQPFLKRIGEIYITKEILNKRIIALVFIILLASSYLTEIIGIHALFGAFLAGVIMPHNLNFKRLLTDKIEDISLVLLLPLFFVLTGLRTEIGLLNNANLWGSCFLIVFTAVLGKFGGSAIAAKVIGQSWNDSLSIGALMNTRGLMELVVLNIGYDLKILNPEIFAMMVIMALFTTFMTGPSLDLINRLFKEKVVQRPLPTPVNSTFKILLSFGPPRMGSTLLKLASQIMFKENIQPEIKALHMTPNNEIQPQEVVMFEKEGFKPIKDTAQLLGIKLATKYKATEEITQEIIAEAQSEKIDLLLMGSAKSIFSEDMVGGKVKEVFDECKCDIGVLMDKGFNYAKQILLIVDDPSDATLLEFGLKFLKTGAKMTVLDKSLSETLNPVFFEVVPNAYRNNRNTFEVIAGGSYPSEFYSGFDLTLLSLRFWKDTDEKKSYLKKCNSILVYKSFSTLD
jgi:Kef-type K+ transport system membrane component KefB